MTAKGLAEQCERLGFAMPRDVIANLENGRRESLTVGELLVLAQALGVSPSALAVPMGYVETIEIAPGQHLPAFDAFQWWADVAELRPALGGVVRIEEPEPGNYHAGREVEHPGWLFMVHDQFVHEWKALVREAPTVFARQAGIPGKPMNEEAAGLLRDEISGIRVQMRELALIPPPLPPDLADLDGPGGSDE